MKSILNSYIKSLLPLAVLIAGVVLFHAFFIAPEMRRLYELREEIADIRERVDYAGAIVYSIPEMRREMESLEEKYETLIRKAPYSARIPRIVEEVSRELDKAGITLLSLSPEESPPGNGPGTVSVGLNLRAGFFSLGEFLKGIEESELLFRVGEFRMRISPVEGELDARMNVKSFFME